ncbi:MAG: 5-(carboxyamino)imidazole ribonucleotide synthase [Bacteroidia bacterium]
MQKSFFKNLKLGIVGGGQLGRMLIQAAVDYNVHIEVLDPSPEAPCRWLAHRFHQGSLTDYDAVMAFGKDLDVITIEIENVNTDALADLQKQGKRVYPDPQTIRLIQDKRSQKNFFQEKNIPTSPFVLVEHQKEVIQQFGEGKFALPAVHKLAKAGYDGRGVNVIRTEEELADSFDAPGLVEDFIPFEKEIAVIAARRPSGEVTTFPPVEMAFHPTANLVEFLFAPADLTAEQVAEVHRLGVKVVEELKYVGVLAVELFLTKEGKLLVNELAPRPHNSGHHTIRANHTSQFEQHLRAILDLPLGDTAALCPAAMVNLLGAPGQTGSATYAGLDEALAIPGVYPHIYGKAETRPFRKMGHTLIIDTDVEALKAKAIRVKDLLSAVSE